jgi:hypothetical protein
MQARRTRARLQRQNTYPLRSQVPGKWLRTGENNASTVGTRKMEKVGVRKRSWLGTRAGRVKWAAVVSPAGRVSVWGGARPKAKTQIGLLWARCVPIRTAGYQAGWGEGNEKGSPFVTSCSPRFKHPSPYQLFGTRQCAAAGYSSTQKKSIVVVAAGPTSSTSTAAQITWPALAPPLRGASGDWQSLDCIHRVRQLWSHRSSQPDLGR